MRAVIDTNVLISGVLWQGPPRSLIVHVRQGDNDLLGLGRYAGIAIVPPTEALTLIPGA